MPQANTETSGADLETGLPVTGISDELWAAEEALAREVMAEFDDDAERGGRDPQLPEGPQVGTNLAGEQTVFRLHQPVTEATPTRRPTQAHVRRGARARASRPAGTRRRGSRRCSASRAGPDDDSGGEPEPPGPSHDLSDRGRLR